MIQRVVNKPVEQQPVQYSPVWQPSGQPAVGLSCIQTFNQLSNRLFNRLCSLITAAQQPVASCKRTFNRLSNQFWQPVECLFTRCSRLFNRFKNPLYVV